MEFGGASMISRSNLPAGVHSLFDRPEALDGDNGLDAGLKAASLPVEACSLGYVEVGNLHGPASIGVFARDQAGEGGLRDAPFLADYRHNNHGRKK